MIDSILTSVKKGVGGITETDTSFDDDLVMHINTVLSQLTQLGVGPKNGFQISGPSEVWSDFVDDVRMNMVQSYVVLGVRMMFDPPTVGAVAEAYKTRIDELEWRLNTQAESKLEL